MSLVAQFNAALERFKAMPGDGQMEQGSLRYKLYGLSKQALEGDCSASFPPKTNSLLRLKWEAWNNCRGRSKESCMTEFIEEMRLLDGAKTGKPSVTFAQPGLAVPVSRPSISEKTSQKGSNAGIVGISANVIKTGTLYKQRDVFKGWRPRKFVLADTILHYFLEPEDPIPKKSMDICGCTITSVRVAHVGEVDYYPFVISHPKSVKVYNLSSDSKEEADDWIEKLRAVASKTDSLTEFKSTPGERLLATIPEEGELEGGNLSSVTGATQSSSSADVVHGSAATDGGMFPPVDVPVLLGNVPHKYALKVDLAVESLVKAVDPSAPNWEPLFEKNGVVARKRAGDVICVRGDGTVPFAIPDILKLMIDVDRMREYNSQLDYGKTLKRFNNNTGVHVLKFKQVWPTAARDFVTVYHWRLLQDGRLVMLSFSEVFDDLCPPASGTVRAELILGGYVMTPLSHTETLMQYVVQSDLKGSLPTSVVNLVSSTQPLIVYHVRKVLTEQFQNSKSKYAGKPFSLQDLIDIAIAVNGPVHGLNHATKSAGVGAAVESDLSNANAPTGSQSVPPVDRAGVVDTPPEVLFQATTASSSSTPTPSPTSAAGVSLFAMLSLLIPPTLYYAIDSSYRAAAFVVSCVLIIRFILKQHLGQPSRKKVCRGAGSLAAGRTLVRFPVDLNKLIRYLEAKRTESGIEITMTHIAVKTAAVVLNEMRSMKGRVLFGNFYPSTLESVDIGVSADITDQETVVLKVDDADLKPVEYIADELIKSARALQADKKAGTLSRREKILKWVPPIIAAEIEELFSFLGSQLGLSIPFLGIVGFPLGVCTVITSPNQTGDADIDIAMIPNMLDSSTPITISIGGIRVLSTIDSDRKLHAAHALNVAVTVDSKAGSLIETRKLCSRLQQYLNNPFLLDKEERKASLAKEDAQIAATNASGLKKRVALK